MTPVLIGSPDRVTLTGDMRKWSRPSETTQVLSFSIRSVSERHHDQPSGCTKWKLVLLIICLALMLSASIAGFVLHVTGISHKSFAVPVKIDDKAIIIDDDDDKSSQPLVCHCRNLDGCMSRPNGSITSPTVTCEGGEVCATSIDRDGLRRKGCMEDRGNLCEFIYMADYGARKPKFSRIEKDQSHHRGRRQRRHKIAHYHFCYCRTHGCNGGNECECGKISSGGGSGKNIFGGSNNSIFMMLVILLVVKGTV